MPRGLARLLVLYSVRRWWWWCCACLVPVRLLEYYLNPGARPLAPLAVKTEDGGGDAKREGERERREQEEEEEEGERQLRTFARNLGLTPSGLNALVEVC